MPGTASKILVVDDSLPVRKEMSDFFKGQGWEVRTASDGRQALNVAKTFLPDIILLDIEMPFRDGITTCRIIKSDSTITKYFPVIMMTSHNDKKKIVQAVEAGCDDFIVKPFQNEILMKKVLKQVDQQNKHKKKKNQDEEAEIVVYSKQVIQDVFKQVSHGELFDYPVISNVINNMVDILEDETTLPIAFKMKTYNDYAYIHSVNVSSLAMSFAYQLGWKEEDLHIIGEGGFLHDVGKTSVNLKILLKPGKLTESEFEQVKKHPLAGRETLRKQNIPEDIIKAASEHHERHDGSGYPEGLNGDEISKYGKLCAIIDVYDALTTDRCYHKGVESEKAINIMSENKGQFYQPYLKDFSKLIMSGDLGK